MQEEENNLVDTAHKPVAIEDTIDTDLAADVAKDSDARVYEVGFNLIPTISVDELPKEYANLKALVTSFGGEIISEEAPKMINLAYQMLKVTSNVRSKFTTAYFGWVKFNMSPANVLLLKKKLDLDATVIRFLILKTVKENTIAAKRFVGRDSAYVRPTGTPATAAKKEDGPAPEINKEEIDREIDALVA